MRGVSLAFAGFGALIGSLPVGAAPVTPPPPPLQLTAAWNGAPCNPTGSLTVLLKNVSTAPLSVPKHAIVPILFTVEIFTPKVIYSSVGHPYIYSIYPDHYVTRGGLRTLMPGQSIGYKLEMIDARNKGAFGEAWFRMLRTGGEVAVRYTLPDLFDPEGDQHMFFVDDHNQPDVHSNLLKCRGVRR